MSVRVPGNDDELPLHWRLCLVCGGPGQGSRSQFTRAGDRSAIEGAKNKSASHPPSCHFPLLTPFPLVTFLSSPPPFLSLSSPHLLPSCHFPLLSPHLLLTLSSPTKHCYLVLLTASNPPKPKIKKKRAGKKNRRSRASEISVSFLSSRCHPSSLFHLHPLQKNTHSVHSYEYSYTTKSYSTTVEGTRALLKSYRHLRSLGFHPCISHARQPCASRTTERSEKKPQKNLQDDPKFPLSYSTRVSRPRGDGQDPRRDDDGMQFPPLQLPLVKP